MTSHLRFSLCEDDWIVTFRSKRLREFSGKKKTINFCYINVNDKLADWSIENFALLPFSKEMAALGNEGVKTYILKIKMYKFTNKF